MTPGYHRCPGCDRPRIPDRMFACKPCWSRLPGVLKQGIVTPKRNSPQHRAAMAAAIAWYNTNTDRKGQP